MEKDCRAHGLNTEDAMVRSRWRKQIGMIDDHDECEWVNVSSGTGAISELWSMFLHNAQGAIIPGLFLTVDERLAPYPGRVDSYSTCRQNQRSMALSYGCAVMLTQSTSTMPAYIVAKKTRMKRHAKISAESLSTSS